MSIIVNISILAYLQGPRPHFILCFDAGPEYILGAVDAGGGEATKGSKIPKLKRIPLFTEMSDYDLHQIDQITVERRYDKGEVIIEENTAAERFFIIFRGKIEITKKFEDGEQFVLGVHSDG